MSNFKEQSEGEISKFLVKQDSDVLIEPFVCPVCFNNIFSKDEVILSDHVLACASTDQSPKVFLNIFIVSAKEKQAKYFDYGLL